MTAVGMRRIMSSLTVYGCARTRIALNFSLETSRLSASLMRWLQCLFVYEEYHTCRSA